MKGDRQSAQQVKDSAQMLTKINNYICFGDSVMLYLGFGVNVIF